MAGSTFAPTDKHGMRRAIEVARSKGSDPSTSPLGCVIVLDRREIAAERNQTHERPDATAHAGMMAIRRACEGTGEIDALPALEGHGFEIVRYREERGRFDALRQLEEVPGLAGKVTGLDGMVRFG
jgi:tRNA(Arg) A34 adenosine deaminase TadA